MPSPVKRGRFFALSALLAPVVLASACSSPGPGAEISRRDPHESVNRTVHDANLFMDRNLVRPAASAYRYAAPRILRELVGNAFDHMDAVGDFANHALRGDADNALTSFGRFGINTILGAGGLLDPATEFGLTGVDADFGATLGRYGVGEGAYLILPFLGPSTTRDAWGALVDETIFNPLFHVGVFLDGAAADAGNRAAAVLETVDARARNADLIDDILYESADGYISLRSVYLQRRDALIRGAGAVDDLPDIFDDDDPG